MMSVLYPVCLWVSDSFPSYQDGFGPFSDAAAPPGDGFTFSSSFSDEDSSFESFGDFGDFQAAEDGESTPTTSGSWTFAPGAEFGVFPEATGAEGSGAPSGPSRSEGTGNRDDAGSSSSAVRSLGSSSTEATS